MLINLLEKVVLKYPNKIALSEISGKSISYKELWYRSKLLSDYISNNSNGNFIALYFEKSIEYIISLIAVWMSKKAFIPIDKNQSKERVDYILEKTNPNLVLSDSNDLGFNINKLNEFKNINESDINLYFNDIFYNTKNCTYNDSDIAYVIFTSGTTGKPKGVIVSHLGLSNVIEEQIEKFQINFNSVGYFIYNISFDASFSDIWTVLLAGATLIIDKKFVFKGQESLFKTFDLFNVTHVDLPPSIFKFLKTNSLPKSLKTIILGGENSSIDQIKEWVERGVRIVNVYGPTEATICTSIEVCSINKDKLFIGNPIKDVEYYVTDENELLISGKCLALGYFNDDILTNHKFITINNKKYYKTGDLVKKNINGEIEFVGRLDRQIKLNGFLICPEEIELVIKSFDSIKNSVVVKKNNCLIAYIETTETIDISELKSFLNKFLNSYMIPSDFIFVKKIPLLSTGKIDIGALKKLPLKISTKITDSLNVNLISIIDSYKSVLNTDSTTYATSFFDLGGNSIKVMSLIIDLEKKGINITPEIVYKYSDPQSLNSYLEKENTNYMTLDDLNNELNTIYKKVSFKNISNDEKDEIGKNVLITGATGFLGSRLLTYIIEKFPDYKIYCLVRNPKKLEKIIDISKITILEGDISKEKFNLNDDMWDFLSSEIDEIFHLAADINHFKTYEQLKETNVLSINNIIEFLSVGKSKKLNYASTLAVFVDSFPVPTICKENDFVKNISFIKGGYAQSKWLAEQLLLKIEKPVNINIFRFGLLVNDHSIGIEQSFDWLNSFILGFPEKIPFLKSNKLSFDFTPVSFAIKSMIEISESCVTDDLKIHHITSTRKVTLFELIKALKYCNNKVSRVNKKEWVDYMLSKNLDQNEKISFVSLKNVDSHLSIFKTTNTNFDIRSINKLNLELPIITQKDINLFVKRIINASVQK